HFDQARTQLARVAMPAPTLSLNPNVTDLFSFKFEDIQFNDYQAAPVIKAPIAV
ncbi:MAG: thymidylate synthase, partial [Pseudomonadota bacterium]